MAEIRARSQFNWTVVGRDMKAGEERKVNCRAGSADEASTIAKANGITVTDVYPASQSPKSDAPLLATESSPPAARCANCDVPIGKLERPLFWQNQVVCVACRTKLEAGERIFASAQTTQPVTPWTPPRPITGWNLLGLLSILACVLGTVAGVTGLVYAMAAPLAIGLVLLFGGLGGFVAARLRHEI
jgi:hypothetical protein